MAEIADLRTRSVLPIGTVMLLTDLTARQIRYYETQGLVKPQRNAGNHRTYSLNDVDELLEIRSQMADGFTLADVKRLKHPRHREGRTAESKPTESKPGSRTRHWLPTITLKIGVHVYGKKSNYR